jgi:hypothetical protein
MTISFNVLKEKEKQRGRGRARERKEVGQKPFLDGDSSKCPVWVMPLSH